MASKKTPTPVRSKTLQSFMFTKTPNTAEKKVVPLQSSANVTPVASIGTPKRQRRVILSDSDDGDDVVASVAAKRVRVANDEGDDERADIAESIGQCFFDETLLADGMPEGGATPSSTSLTTPTPMLTSPTVDDAEPTVRYKHLDYAFLQEGNIRDSAKRALNHADYDPTTLYVPPSFVRGETGGLAQWWAIKAKHFDKIILFKVGKFYELYHEDAVVAVRDLNITMMRDEKAHCGFPEVRCAYFVGRLVAKGHKVVRVEQVQRPADMPKGQKVVDRHVVNIATTGTLVESSATPFDKEETARHEPRLLVAVVETRNSLGPHFGVCIVDVSDASFVMGSFADDEYCTCLRTALARYPPSQLLTERGKISPATTRVLHVNNAPIEGMSSTAAWSGARCRAHLADRLQWGTDKDGWPSTIAALSDDDETTWRAFGMVSSYLTECQLYDVCHKNATFTTYKSNASEESLHFADMCLSPLPTTGHMVLDDNCLMQLDIMPLQRDEVKSHTLLNHLDRCHTAMGHRLLRAWLCAPLLSCEAIRERQSAVILLRDSNADQVTALGKSLRRLPDLPRLLHAIHLSGSAHRSTTHAEASAIMFEGDKINKRKIGDLVNALKAFRTADDIRQMLLQMLEQGRSSRLLTTSFVDDWLDYTDDLEHFASAFDETAATTTGEIEAKAGVVPEYDAAVEGVHDAMAGLETYRVEMTKKFSCKDMKYFGAGRNRYQLEIPEALERRLGTEFEFKSKRKGFKRYHTPEITRLFETLTRAEVGLDVQRADIMRKMFAEFDQRRTKWQRATAILGQLDVLLSLADYASSSGASEMVMPVVEEATDNVKPYMHITSGIHPCLLPLMAAHSIIANDVSIGEPCPITLLTGANMGGKSTIMRQVAVTAILAQIGSAVPARACRLTPVDRVFTRLGANDRMALGQSTFMVEMMEMFSVLRHSTSHSLVIVDELGRGTSTHDGMALAQQVLAYMCRGGSATFTPPRTLFATHYHSLVTAMSEHADYVHAMHMECLVEDNEADPSAETVIFMYKLVDGAAPKSYGFNAAKIAGVDTRVICRSREYARQAAHLHRYAHDECVELIAMCKQVDVGGDLASMRRQLRDIHV